MPLNLGYLNNDFSQILLLLAGEVCLCLKHFSSNSDVCVFIFFREIKKKRKDGEGIGVQ